MTGTEIAEYEPQSGTLALSGDQVEWSPVQQAALAHIGIDKAPTADQQVFMHVCQRVRLDPFAKQIYMIGRTERGKNGAPDTVKYSIQTGIDGFRLIAERHPQYAGTLDPEWCGEDGVWREAWVDRKHPVMARVKVLRHDRQNPVSLPVRFWEFADTFSDGNLRAQWKAKPAHMIAKVAEAAALRKAFPQELSGLYTDDEMASATRAPDSRSAAARGTTTAVTAAELTGQVVDAEPEPADEQTSSREEHPAAPGGEAVGAAAPRSQAPPPSDPDPDPTEVPDSGPADPEPKAKPIQIRQLGALMGEAEVGDADRHHVTGLLLGVEVTSWSTLTVAQAQKANDELRRLKKSGHENGLAGAVKDLVFQADQERMESELAAENAVDGEIVDEDQADGDGADT